MKLALIAGLILLSLFGAPEIGYASSACDNPPPSSDPNKTMVCMPWTEDNEIICYWDRRLITDNVFQCVRTILNQIGNSHIQKMTDGLAKAASAMMAIAIIFISIKMALGKDKMAQESIIAIIKILIVAGLMFQVTGSELGINYFRELVIDFMIAAGNLVSSSLTTQNLLQFERATVNAVQPQNFLQRFDLIVLDVFGYDPTAGGPMFIGLFALLASLIVKGPWGILFYMVLTFVMAAILTTLVQIIYMYVVSMLAITLLFAFSPFFIPLILFDYTKRLFEQWLQFVFSFVFQPIVMSAYLALTITVMNQSVIPEFRRIYNEVENSAKDAARVTYVSLYDLPIFQGQGREYSQELFGGLGFVVNPTKRSPNSGQSTIEPPISQFNYSGKAWMSAQQPLVIMNRERVSQIRESIAAGTSILHGDMAKNCTYGTVQTACLGNLVIKGRVSEAVTPPHTCSNPLSECYMAMVATGLEDSPIGVDIGELQNNSSAEYELTYVEGLVSDGWRVKQVNWTWRDMKHMLATLLACSILMYLMAAFMRKLPFFVTELIGNRMVVPLAQYTASVGNFSDRLKGALGPQGASGATQARRR